MSKATKTKGNPLSKYNPIRFANARTGFLDEAVETFFRLFGNGVKGIFSKEHQKIEKTSKIICTGLRSYVETSRSSELFPTCLRAIYRQGMQHVILGEATEAGSFSEVLKIFTACEVKIFRHYASFIYSGNNIFDFSSELLKLFWETDVDDVLLEDINLPFETVYLYFGKQEGKKLYGTMESIQVEFKNKQEWVGEGKYVEFFLDGAYVSQCPESGALDIILTGIPNTPHKYSDNCVDCYEETVNYKLEVTCKGVTVAAALEEQRKKIFQHNQTFVQQKQAKHGFSIDVIETALRSAKDYINTSIEQFMDCLKLTINCLLYLQSYPEEIEDGYPQLAPKNLVAQTKRGSALAQVAEQKLSKLGFRKIKFCGKAKKPFEQVDVETVDEQSLLEEPSTTTKAGRSLSPHKRRAHRRRQRYGKGLKLWRFVWIRETTIRPEKYQQPQNLYRIYEVVPEDGKP